VDGLPTSVCPSSVALSLRTTLDRAVYLTIYKNIRWRVHDLWVDTWGLVYMGSWRWIPPFLLKGVSYLRVVCLGKEISLSDCFGAVVQDPGHSSCRHGESACVFDLHIGGMVMGRRALLFLGGIFRVNHYFLCC
jgi:hypothetical protein